MSSETSKVTIYATPAHWERLMASWSGEPAPCLRLEHEFKNMREELVRLKASVNETLEGEGDVRRITMHVTPPQLQRLLDWGGAIPGAPWLHFSCERLATAGVNG